VPLSDSIPNKHISTLQCGQRSSALIDSFQGVLVFGNGLAACDALHLKVGDDPATRFVAEKVIELAQRGVRDPDTLREMALKEFGLSDESASVSEKSGATDATGYATPRS
jgi:hypothetical protein